MTPEGFRNLKIFVIVGIIVTSIFLYYYIKKQNTEISGMFAIILLLLIGFFVGLLVKQPK